VVYKNKVVSISNSVSSTTARPSQNNVTSNKMRSISAILATLAIASLSVQALLPPDQPTRRAYTSASISSSSTDHYKPTDPIKPVPTTSYTSEPYKPEPTSTYVPEHPKPSDKPEEPEYETVCQKFAFFHGWDLDCGDVSRSSRLR
jgi:hypothetical protein